MILHLLFDDKFGDVAINLFDKVNNIKSRFVLIVDRKDIKYIKQVDKVHIYNINEFGIEQILSNINKYNAIIFHGAFYPWQEDILKAIQDSNINKAWHVWGGEIYGQQDLKNSFLAPFSKYLNRFHKLIKSEKSQYIFPKELLRKIDYCLTSIDEEYLFIKNYLKVGDNFRYLWYSCYNIEDTIGKSLLNEECYGSNIWLGNSAAVENNYFDIFFYLKRYINIENRKIIVPLSYGTPWVRRFTIKLGNILFKKNFYPLVEFLPREEYNRIMLDCSVMIQPHWRQQAHGNILTGLWLGMRVYISEKSIEYKFLKRLGVIVYSIEKDLKCDNINLFKRLPKDEMMINRNILAGIYGKENVKRAIINVAEILDKKY